MITGDYTTQYIGGYNKPIGESLSDINQPVEWNERGILNTAHLVVFFFEIDNHESLLILLANAHGTPL